MGDEEEKKVDPPANDKEAEAKRAKAAAKKKKEEEEARTRVKLKEGAYQVQVHIIEARDLIGVGAGDRADPVFQVHCMQKKETSRIYKEQLSPFVNETLYFEFPSITPAELEAGRVRVDVKDANTVRRDVLIGSFSLDLTKIYYMTHHELFRQWVAITDITGKRKGIQGYLKLSVVVLHADDEQHTHTAEEEDDEGDDMMAVMLPPTVDQTPKILRVQAYEVASLPAMDEGIFGGKCDPYVKVEFGGITLKTKRKKGQTAVIAEELVIPVFEPVMSTTIRVHLYDWDAAGGDDRITSFSIDYNDVKEFGLAPAWHSMYGAPEGKQNHKDAKKMNKSFMEGSFYRGRCLISAQVEDVPEDADEDPEKEVRACSGLPREQRPAETMYRLQFDLYEGSEIANKGKMHVEVSCGDNYFASRAAEPKEGRSRWYDVIRAAGGKEIDLKLPEDPDQCPDVFVYLCVKKKRLSFRRFKFGDLLGRGWAVPPSWHALKEDTVLDAFDSGKAEFPGALLFSLRVGPRDSCPEQPLPSSRPLNYVGGAEALEAMQAAGDDAEAAADAERQAAAAAEAAPVSEAGTLTLEVIEARDLPAMDRNTSDPYVRVAVGKQKFKTKVIKEELNPKWNETFTFTNVPIRSFLEVGVFDSDRLGKDDCIGECSVDLRTQQTQSSSDPGHDFVTDNWVLISDAHPNAAVRLRFTFKYLSLSESQSVLAYAEKQAAKEGKSLNPLKMLKRKEKRLTAGELGMPEQSQYQLRFHLYQARALPATDSSGLCDAYAVVRLCGKMVKTKVKKETVNPMWYQTYAFNVELPVPLSLAPDIQLYFFDHDQFSKDDVLGRMSVPVTKALSMNPSVLEITPEWMPLYDWDDKQLPDSRVLCSLQLIDARDAAVPLPDIRPETTPMFVDLVTLGFRGLQNKLGVHKTFASFELPNGRKIKTETSKKPDSKNPNFLQVLKIPIDLPVDKLFAPSLDIEAIDTLAGGLIKRRIGAAALDLGDFMEVAEDDDTPEDGEWTSAKVEVLDEDELAREIKQMEEERRREAERKLKEETDRKMAEVIEAERAAAAAGGGGGGALLAHGGGHLDDDSPVNTPREDMGLLGAERSSGGGGGGGGGGDVVMDDDADFGLGDLPDVKPVVPTKGTEEPDAVEMVAIDVKGGDDDDEKKEGGSDDEADEDRAALESARPGEAPGAGGEGTLSSNKLVVPPVKPGEENDQPEYMRGRPVCDNELEDVLEMEPFHKVPLYSGKKNAGPLEEEFHQIGTFKGLVRLVKDKDEPNPFDLAELLQPKDVFIRVYIMEGMKLTPQDPDGSSDPYLKVRCGKFKFSTRKNYHKNNLNPGFFDSIEIPTQVPGCGPLEIQVWDYDGIGDDLIGQTTIDLEDRWFTKEWRMLPLKPVEVRTLRAPSSSLSQGKLSLWVEVLDPLEAKKQPLLNIKPPPPQPYELRVIVWDAKKVAVTDLTTNQGDLYVSGQLSMKGSKRQETDIHLRAKRGKGSWRWRLVWKDLMLPFVDKTWPRLEIKLWDMDVFSSNDAIAMSTLSLKGICRQAIREKDNVKMLVKGKDRFWIESMTHPNYPGENRGMLEISVELLPKEVAAQLPAGVGRSDPNANPYLPEPVGRPKFSLFHPCDLLRELLGDRLYFKIIGMCCAALLVSACFFIAPMVFSQTISSAINPFD